MLVGRSAGLKIDQLFDSGSGRLFLWWQQIAPDQRAFEFGHIEAGGNEQAIANSSGRVGAILLLYASHMLNKLLLNL